MSLPEVSIHRPVFATVMSMVIVLFGIVGFTFLGVREYPAVDPPIITVNTNYSGANAAVVDSQITEPLEQAINGIAGVRSLVSTSREGQSQIRVEFEVGSDLEAAANDVRDKVSGAVRNLPADADPPVTEKADADAEPVIFLTVRSATKPVADISNLASSVIKERLQTIPGVSTVRIFGEKRYAMRLWLDAQRMAAHGVTVADVQAAVNSQNVELPSGRVEGLVSELAITTDGRLDTPEEFERVVIKSRGRQVELRDIGFAELSAQNLRTGLKSNFEPMIGCAVVPQPNTNAIAIADEFYRRFEQIKKEIPPEYEVEIGFDFTSYVRSSVTEVQETLLIAFILVALIIYLFLRDWRSALIPVVAIPVSIVSAFFIMYLAGFTINVLTLVGLVLAIGLVCDDAIVVLENIYSKVEAGLSPLDAAIQGSKEIYFAVISTTITLAAVFVPIIFLQGLTGRLFREFGVVVAGSVLVSAFVSLTLSPMMCRFLLRPGQHGRFYRFTEPFFEALTSAYRGTLRGFMRVRWLVFPILVAVIVGMFVLQQNIPTELAPLEDRSNIRINFSAPEGATVEYTARELDQIGVWVKDNIPEMRRSFQIVGGFGGAPNTGIQNIYLVDPQGRQRSQAEIVQQISGAVGQFKGVRAFPSQPPTIGNRRGGAPVQYVLQAPNLTSMIEVLPRFLEKAQQSKSLRFVDADFKVNRPELKVEIDRARAAELGVGIREVARTLQQAYGGVRYGFFILDGKQYDIIGQMQRVDRDAPEDLLDLQVRAADGTLVSLDALISLEEQAGPAALYRFDRYLAATISATPAPGFTMGQCLDELDAIAAEVLPEGFTTSLTGQARDFKDSASSLWFAFAGALILIYLVLAAQFESFIDPLVIFTTVPLSVTGALLSLWFENQTLNVFSQIGIIMLIGLVTKNGILIVEFANQRKEGGMGVRDAVIEASVTRFRPIMMTSLSTILGVLPIALQLGTSAGSRQSLGVAVVGGLIFSGFLTLYVVPAVYSFFSRAVAHAPQKVPAAAPEPAGIRATSSGV